MDSIGHIFTTLDLIVFLLILVITFLFVIYGMRRKAKNQDSLLDYFLMGRQLTLPFFVATLVSSWYGGIFGVTQIAFEKGIFNFLTQGVFWYATYIIFAIFFVKRSRIYNAVTLPEMIGKMFGPWSGKLSAVFNFFNVMPIAYVISIGLIIQPIFGIPVIYSMLIGMAFVVFYSMFGGFRADVFSDFIQFGVMCSGVALVFGISVFEFGGLDFLKANLPATHFSPLGGEGLATTLVWGFIALSTLVDPVFYQRCFAAKDSKVARNGILISTIIWFCFDICTTAGGMYARAVLPDVSSNKAYLVYCMQILPSGLRGFAVAGIVATVLSTLDSYLLIAATTLTYDLSPKRMKRSKIYHKLGIVFVALFAILLAHLFEGDIKSVWKTLGSYYAACLLFPVVWGFVFPGKTGDKHFVISCLMGVIATTYWRLAGHAGFWANVDELYIGVAATAAGLLLYRSNKKSLRGVVDDEAIPCKNNQ